MIRRLVLRNFQAHERLDIRLNRVTSIVGTTDAGKSAIIRALKWLLFNKPGGASFMKHGANRAGVVAWFGKLRIGRWRSKTENSYKLNRRKLISFGAGVPDPVTNKVNVDAANLQQQHDPPFWLTLSPSQAARELNSIVDLSVMDAYAKAANANVRRSRDSVRITEQRLDECREKLKTGNWVARAVRSASQIERASRTLRKLESRLRRLQKLSKQVAELRKELLRLRALLQIAESRGTITKLELTRDQLLHLVANKNRLQGILKSHRETLASHESKLRNALKKRCPLCLKTTTP